MPKFNIYVYKSYFVRDEKKICHLQPWSYKLVGFSNKLNSDGLHVDILHPLPSINKIDFNLETGKDK